MTARLSGLEKVADYRKDREPCLVSKGGQLDFISFPFFSILEESTESDVGRAQATNSFFFFFFF